MPTLKVLADVIAQGFRGLKDELRAQRLQNERMATAVVEFTRSQTDRDKRFELEHQDFKNRLEDLEKAAQ